MNGWKVADGRTNALPLSRPASAFDSGGVRPQGRRDRKLKSIGVLQPEHASPPGHVGGLRLESATELLDPMRNRIDAVLSGYVQFDDNCPAQLREGIRYALLGPGKRLRPRLVLTAAESCGAAADVAMPAACAVEMVHAYSLVHDDLPAMDDDDLRRGRPTCHKQFGEATAILVGDALLARAFEILANLPGDFLPEGRQDSPPQKRKGF